MSLVIPVRTSERTCFKTCRQKWWWSYVERWESTRQRPALEFGTLVHAALAVRYRPGSRRGPHPARTFTTLYDKAIDLGKLDPIVIRQGEEGEVKLDGRELGIAMLNGFVETYGKDERYRVIKPEMSFQLDVLHPKTKAYLFTYVSTTDVLVEDLEYSALGFIEWKTSSNLEPFGAPLTLDEQANSYWTFGTRFLHETGVLKEQDDVKFMLYTFLRKAMPDTRPTDADGHALNQNGSISKRQPQPLFRRERVMRGQAERRNTFIRAMHEAREMQLVRNKKLAVYKNPDRHCLWCEFKDPCEVHETGSDYRAILDSLFVKWDPYEAHQDQLALDIAKELING